MGWRSYHARPIISVMISFPFTWKAELKFQLGRVQDYVRRAAESQNARDYEDASAWLEHFAHHAAFTVRRLCECGTVCEDVQTSPVDVLIFQRREAAQDSDATSYDFQNPVEATLPIRELCNQLIHCEVSFEGVVHENNTALSGLLFASDRTRSQRLYYVELVDLFELVGRVADDGFDEPYDFEPTIPAAASSSEA